MALNLVRFRVMETPLTPLEFARRARKLHGQREAVVDGNYGLLTPNSASDATNGAPRLRRLGVGKGDRVATIAPNTHQHLEQFYAIPQLGAVIVPINYRLSAEDFVYLTAHSGAIGAVRTCRLFGRRRGRSVAHAGRAAFCRLGRRERPAGYHMSRCSNGSGESCDFPDIAETDLLSINYTSGTTSRPKGVMITHRNAWINSVGALAHWPMTPADRYLWTLPMFHANGWTFVWTVTAAGSCACLPACGRCGGGVRATCGANE